MAVELSDGVFWVGAVDWNVRNFHGYTTHRGTTYNTYLVLGEKKALIDTVKKPFFGEMLGRIKEVIDPAELDYIILNHMEMDHSTSFPDIKALAPKAKVIVSKKFGEDNLRKIFHGDWDLTPVTEEGKVDRIRRRVRLVGDLSSEERARLLEIANRCPVHRTLHSEIRVETVEDT